MILSPVDHLFTGRGAYPINFLFYFEGKIDPHRLRASLDEVLAVYTPCKSHLAVVETNTLGFIENSKGYQWTFLEKEMEPPIDDLAALKEYCSSAKSIPGESLLHVTLTHFRSGSSLGVSISHCVVDGYSYFMFLTAWAKCFNGKSAPPPMLNRRLLVPEKPYQETGLDPETIFEKTGFSFVDEVRPGDEAEVKWEVQDFSKSELDTLYRMASEDVPQRLSMNDVLSAELWKRLVNKHQKRDEILTFSCAYDYRRVYAKVNAFYFGNAIRGAAFRLSGAEVLDLKLGELALRINSTVKSIDPESVEASLKCLENLRLKKGLHPMERFHVANPYTGFLVTNLSRLPMLDLDFGAGVPKEFRILTPAKRTAVVLPLKDGLRVQTAF